MSSRIATRALTLGLLLVALAVGPAAAAPVVDGEFPVSGLDSNNKLVTGPDRNVWVTLSSTNKDVARITPAGEVTEYDLAAENASGIAVADEKLWITRNGGVTSFEPGDPEGTANATAIGTINGNHSIVLGPDGNLWVAANDNLVRIAPGNPSDNKSFAVLGLGPRDVDVAGSLLVVADFGSERVLTATTTDPPATTDYLVGGGPQGVAGGPGGQIAYTQPTNEPKETGIFTPPGTPSTSQFPGADPFGIAFGPDGAYWTPESNGDRLLRLTTDNQVSELKGFVAGSRPRQIAPGPGNTLWVTLEDAKKVGRVSGVDPPATTPISAPVAEPRTRIRKGPKGKVKTRRKRATVKFRFGSPDAGARFECRLKRLKKGAKPSKKGPKKVRRFKPCKSPRTYRLSPGRYRFEVRAVLDGVADRTPAKRTFRVIRVAPKR